MSHQHITSIQRNNLAVLIRTKLQKKDIAKLLSKDRSTIYRELKRNHTDNIVGYDVGVAKRLTEQRRIKANSRFRKIENDKNIEKYIIKKLKLYWSPEQIAGRLKKDNRKKIVGKDTIYKFIYQKRPRLVKYLRCQKGGYRRRYGTRIKEKQREEAKKKRIDQRSKIIEQRERIGDWEGDTMIGTDRKSAILTHVERKSGLLLADKLKRATKDNTHQTTIKRFNRIPKNKRYSITYDNGTEFSEHEAIGRDTKMEIYFAYPYHSWERGTNENTNGLLRQFFPKKTSFNNIEQKELNRVVWLINNRPRKRHNYSSPIEMFERKD